MVIQNSEVQMASKGSFTATTKVDYRFNQTPAFQIGNITFAETGEVEEADTGELAASNKQVRMETLSYLLRVLLLGKIFGEDSSFSEMLSNIFNSNQGYMQTTMATYEYTESQEVEFSSKGSVTTADGRNIDFNYDFRMSSSFHEEFQTFSSEFVRYVDPLVVNLNDCPTRVSDQKFYFDMDGDGQEEEVNSLGQGSGFLALDKNEDGEINDGTELFGAKTGDGFKELMIFDEDQNGWIDENDSIFDKLRVWTLNENDEMELYTLKESDVGAIYLGKVKTDFIDKDGENKARAAIRESGIFLHESDGHAGGVQHVDFAT